MTSRTALPSNPFRAPERALPATTRLDEFEIERVLAQSSFAVVYRAYDHALKLHVAIKEYLPDALALRSAETQVVLRARTHAERFELGLQAFIDEAQTLARCDHPALLRILRILQRHGTAYRVMRYSPGPTLLAHRRELAATPDARALRTWLDALLGALDALHEEGCVHAAVAPGNILLLPGDRPMLLDLEAVPTALISDRTQSMMAALEPCFEPVEQRAPTSDMAMGPWTDLYALAATLHFCISGQLPAPPSGTTATQAFEPLVAVWQRLRSAQAELGEAPHWLNALDACLLDAPARRPQSVAQLRGLLDAGASVPVASAPGTGVAVGSAGASAPGMPAPAGRGESAADTMASWLASLPAVHAASLPGARSASPPVGESVTPVAPAAGRPDVRPAAATAGAHSAMRFDTPAPTRAPAPAPTAMEASHAKVIADLDKTFAFIAAQANEDATPSATAAAAGAGVAAEIDVGPTTQAAADPRTAEPASTGGPATAKPLTRQQLWMAGAVGLLMLVAMAATVAWLLKETQPGLVGGGGVDSMKSLTAPVLAPSGNVAAPGNAFKDYPPPAAGPARNGDTAPPPPAPTPPPSPANAKATATKARPAPTSPREACGERTRFALYQCMQTQCAKPAWTKHAQCVKLRKEQKLG